MSLEIVDMVQVFKDKLDIVNITALEPSVRKVFHHQKKLSNEY